MDADVAQYYDEHPLQLAHDFPEVSQAHLWRHIGRMLEESAESLPARTTCRGPDGLRGVCDAFNEAGQLLEASRQRWAEREGARVRRARQLGLPEQNPNQLASPSEVRRARMRLVS